MNTTFDILVIVLSSLLGIFLLLSIVAVASVIKLVKTLRELVAKGEHLVDSAEAIGEVFTRNAGAAGILKMLLKFITSVSKK